MERPHQPHPQRNLRGCLTWAALLGLLLPAAALAQPGLVGGWRDRSASDPDVQEAAAFALERYNKASNSDAYYKIQKILEARSQVVAGIKYSLTIELVKTVCKKKGGSSLKAVDLQRCEVSSEAEQEKDTCIFQVWTRSWLKDTQLLQMSCKSS